MLATELRVGDPVRARAGVTILASLAVVVAFGALTVLAKEIRVLEVRQPWQDDPYDVPVSFDFLILPVLVVIGALRVRLCRRFEPLPVRRVLDLLRVCGVAVLLSALTELVEWIAVLLGQQRAEWSALTMVQLATLALFSVITLACAVRLRRVRRELGKQARGGAQPDWLTDAVALAVRWCRRLGPLAAPAERTVGRLDRDVVRRVRAHPIAAAAALAAVLSLPFVTVKVFLEQYPAALALFVFALSFAGFFAFVVAAGAYLRVVTPRQPEAPVWLCATVVGCVGGLVTFGLHGQLLPAMHLHQTAGTLSLLLFGGGIPTGLLSCTLQRMFRRLRRFPSRPA